MSSNLRDNDIEVILGILDGWPDGKKLTWSTLIEAIAIRLGKTWSRQALDRHARIKDAFGLRKSGLRGELQSHDGLPPELQRAQEAINRLEAENARLKDENLKLLEQFARWAYNAYSKGISEDILNRPLPNTNRERTRR